MKNHLGKILIIYLFLTSFLFGSSLATYKLTANKKEAMLYEPINIKFEAKQIDNTDNMFFLLKPKNSEDYEIHLLKKIIDDSKKHNTSTTFLYVLFPKKAKKILVSFDFFIQTASDSAIAQSYVDDHDDSIAIQTKTTKIQLKPIAINVKQYNKKIDLVGDFLLTSNCNPKKIKQFDDVNLVYTLKGIGYKIKKQDILPDIQGVNKFFAYQNEKNKLTKKGFDSLTYFTYALSGDKSFFIPSITLQAYSPQNIDIIL